ncbi:dehydrodolichyl diphosphate synthase 2-like [Telopea speciosissima]|uniref:dehydrodolichyl diphosphate synthase 2-like n=1 Tax=Telopea speciosissima TaxID=54955 RepID=UPI001CC7E224|nr:dehydrodolichyl diphosphate synthase 2-like [Telopea speciosissima]
MLSLQLSLPPINNGFSHYIPKPVCLFQDRSRSSSRNLSRAFPSLLKYIFCASTTPADVVFKEEEVKGTDSGSGTPAAEATLLPDGLRPEFMPNHVAVIMDGNVRWARQKNLPPSFGHEAGVRALREVTELCCKWGISVLTVFAFSTENWIRPKVEVDFLMNLFERVIKEDLNNYMRENIRISVIGDSTKLPVSLQKLIIEAEEVTRNNSRFQLIIAVSYSGQYDIVQACRSIADKVNNGLIQPNDISEALIEQELETNCTDFPHPDLLIRTSGEQRVSNFLLWQLAYTELVFVQPLWPDFGKAEFVDAVSSYQQRRRRYGGRDS